ncbi:MAG: phage terminase large subunit [Gemmataceae bacterium]
MPRADVIRAQPGPQRRFLACDADIVVYGGAAGGGKSYALLLDPLRYVGTPGFRGVVFRRTYPQITEGGGLWDTAMEVYPHAGARANRSSLTFTFPSGARVAFRHLQYEQTIYNWQGAQVPWLGFDEGTHFTERQFLYLLSRNRTAFGTPPRVRLTCNPDANSWLAGFLAWWIDPARGTPDPARAGRMRWLYRDNDENHWYDTRAAAEAAHPALAAVAPPKSVAFVPATLDDNQELMRTNPEYKANLLAQSRVERERLLGGNWKVTAADGMFRADWFRSGDPPASWAKQVRAWDLAATEPKDGSDPDYVVGVLMGKAADGKLWVLGVERGRLSPLKVKDLIRATADRDGADVGVVIEQEPGASGKIVAEDFRKLLAGRNVVIDRPDKRTGDKVTRAHGYSAACERGEVWVAPGGWVRPFVAEHVQFPFGTHDDQVDAAATAYRLLHRPAATVTTHYL